MNEGREEGNDAHLIIMKWLYRQPIINYRPSSWLSYHLHIKSGRKEM